MKRRLTVADFKAFPSDPPAIQAIFAENKFKPAQFLNNLATNADGKEKISEYLNILEKSRAHIAQVAATVDRIPSYNALKAR